MAGFRIALGDVPFVVLAVVEIFLIAAVLWGIFAFEQATRERSAARETVLSIDVALIALLDAETGERGYLISGNEIFLEPYADASDRLDRVLSDLQARVEGDPKQAAAFEALTPLVDEALATMETAIQTRRTEGEAATNGDIVLGKELMDQIRRQLGAMHDDASVHLASRIDTADRLGRVMGIASISLTAVTLVLVGWLSVVTRRRHEAQHLRALAEAKDEFVGFVAHELRTPIALIAGNARHITGDTSEQEKNQSAQEIVASADRLERTIETLLALASAEAGEVIDVEPILVQRILQRAASIHRRQYPESNIELRISDPLPFAMGNDRAIEQVLLNLLSNAAKYGVPGEPIEIRAWPIGEFLQVAVENPGTPVTREDLRHVFEPFFRSPSSASAAPGIGLGLTVCHRLVTAQGGRMSVRQARGGKVSFGFTLPIVREANDSPLALPRLES